MPLHLVEVARGQVLHDLREVALHACRTVAVAFAISLADAVYGGFDMMLLA